MAFQRFIWKCRMGGEWITIRRSGAISFSIAARKKIEIDSKKAAFLYYCEKTRRIAIELLDKKEDGAASVCRTSRDLSINVNMFFEHFDIDIAPNLGKHNYIVQDNKIIFSLK